MSNNKRKFSETIIEPILNDIYDDSQYFEKRVKHIKTWQEAHKQQRLLEKIKYDLIHKRIKDIQKEEPFCYLKVGNKIKLGGMKSYVITKDFSNKEWKLKVDYEGDLFTDHIWICYPCNLSFSLYFNEFSLEEYSRFYFNKEGFERYYLTYLETKIDENGIEVIFKA